MFPSPLLILLLIIITAQWSYCLQCYECSSRLGFHDYDGCRYGKPWYLRKVECIGPSVCATYILTGNQEYSTSTVVNRGCQAIRYGSTCEDIFNDIRRRGPVFPGHHECSTCSSDYCNSSSKVPVSVLMMYILTSFNFSSHL